MAMYDRCAIITDTHIGVRSSSQTFRELFREWYRDVFFEHIKRDRIDTIIHAGDFFDSRNSISLQDIDYIVNEWIPQLEASGATMYIIPGNHDIAFKNTNRVTSLSLLRSKSIVIADDVTVINAKDGEGKSFVLCPWLNNENKDEMLSKLSRYATDEHILVGHFEIAGALMYRNSPPCEHGLPHNTFETYHKVLSGHFHHASSYGNIDYIGAAFHYTWQDYDDYRGYLTYDRKNNEFQQHENEFCLFTRLSYSDDLLKLDDTSLAELTQSQFVQVVINSEYNKVDLRDLVYRIEKNTPLSVDIIDNTILDNTLLVEAESNVDTAVRTVNDYFMSYVDEKTLPDAIDKAKLKTLVSALYNEAESQMREIV